MVTPAASAARPAGSGGFFGWGRDNLSRIRGIDEPLEKRINAEGIKTYHQVETMSVDDERDLESRLGISAGTIAREDWRAQAALLREGHEDDHARRYA
jgi:predicted flap endonuclease-1-like 5' DNA nuclease